MTLQEYGGNVGVGIATPAARFHVAEGTQVIQVYLVPYQFLDYQAPMYP